MPVYTYQCDECGARKEVIRRITDPDEPPTCDTGKNESDPIDCKNQPMSRVITPTTFILKGGCWAKDGYKK